jgi:hypothetical protein
MSHLETCRGADRGFGLFWGGLPCITEFLIFTLKRQILFCKDNLADPTNVLQRWESRRLLWIMYRITEWCPQTMKITRNILPAEVLGHKPSSRSNIVLFCISWASSLDVWTSDWLLQASHLPHKNPFICDILRKHFGINVRVDRLGTRYSCPWQYHLKLPPHPWPWLNPFPSHPVSDM